MSIGNKLTDFNLFLNVISLLWPNNPREGGKGPSGRKRKRGMKKVKGFTKHTILIKKGKNGSWRMCWGTSVKMEVDGNGAHVLKLWSESLAVKGKKRGEGGREQRGRGNGWGG